MGRQTALLQTSVIPPFLRPLCVLQLTHTSCVLCNRAADCLGTGRDLGDVALLCEGGPGRSLSRPTHLAVVEAPLLSPLTPGGCVFPFHSPSAFLSHSFSIDSEMEGQRS